MQDSQINFPGSLNPAQESNPFLGKLKEKARKHFSFTTEKSLFNCLWLSYWLVVFEKEREALELCEFVVNRLSNAVISNKWWLIENYFALASRLHRKPGAMANSQAYLQVLLSRVVTDRAKDGGLLDFRNLNWSLTVPEIKYERGIRLRMLAELCLMIEIGGSERYGSDKWPVTKLERMFDATKSRLRILAEHPRTKRQVLDKQFPPPLLE